MRVDAQLPQRPFVPAFLTGDVQPLGTVIVRYERPAGVGVVVNPRGELDVAPATGFSEDETLIVSERVRHGVVVSSIVDR